MTPTAATRARTNKTADPKPAAETPAAPAAAVPENETDNQKRNRLRNEAERYILNLHKDEFADYAERLFSENGLTFNRRLTEAEKAERKIQELIAKHPELEDALRRQFAVAETADGPEEVGEPVEQEVEETGFPFPEEGADFPTNEDPFAEPNYDRP